MVVCKIEKYLDFNGYEPKAGDEKFRLTLDFFGVEKPKVGDVIALHKNVEWFTTAPAVSYFEQNTIISG